MSSDAPDPMRRTRRSTDTPPSAAEQYAPPMDPMLEFAVEKKASDLHISAGIAPTVRVGGELVPIPDAPVLSPEISERLVASVMTADQRQAFERELELDFSFGRRGLGRYRVSVFRERGDVSAVLRRIPDKPVPLDDLGLPRAIGRL